MNSSSFQDETKSLICIGLHSQGKVKKMNSVIWASALCVAPLHSMPGVHLECAHSLKSRLSVSNVMFPDVRLTMPLISATSLVNIMKSV